jgi:membrane-associated PAP2 superfamily phosphatase
MRKILVVASLLALAVNVGACDSGGGGSSASGVSGSKQLVSLTSAEKGKLCDWSMAKFGGYGTRSSCSSPLFSYADQAACMADSPSPTSTPSCQATVAQMEACVNSLPACPTLTDVGSSSQCAALASC